MTSEHHDNRAPSPQPNTRRRDMFRGLVAIFTLVVAWFAFTPATGVESGLPWDKANHALAFLVWTLLVGCGWPRAGVVRVGAVMLGLGIGIELIQGLPAVGRDADGLDVVADMVGFAAGWGLLAAAGLRRRLGLVRG